MTDKELLQEALYALTYVGDKEIYSDTIDALRARLAQPEREWVGLTDEEAQKTFARHNCTISTDLAGILARAITAKLKEKNK